MNAWISTVLSALDAERCDAKEIVSRPRKSFAKLSRVPWEDVCEKLSCLWRIDKRGARQRKKILFAEFTREFLVELKICDLNGTWFSARINTEHTSVMRLYSQSISLTQEKKR